MTRPNDKKAITEIVTRFFHAVDTDDWTTVRALLTDPVDVAHGPQQITLSSEDLAYGWKESHTKFDSTNYQLESVDVELTGDDRATARFSSRATFTPPAAADETTLVIAGDYTVGLERSGHTWSIRSIRHDETHGNYSH